MGGILSKHFDSVVKKENIETMPESSAVPKRIESLEIGTISEQDVQDRIDTNTSAEPVNLLSTLYEELN